MYYRTEMWKAIAFIVLLTICIIGVTKYTKIPLIYSKFDIEQCIPGTFVKGINYNYCLVK